jgi:hypothetical protein
MVMLTATLPLSEKDELFWRMYVEREQVELIRAATARTNVAYRVIRVGKAAKKKEVEEIVVRTVRQKLRKHKNGKVVVYGNSVPHLILRGNTVYSFAFALIYIARARTGECIPMPL